MLASSSVLPEVQDNHIIQKITHQRLYQHILLNLLFASQAQTHKMYFLKSFVLPNSWVCNPLA